MSHATKNPFGIPGFRYTGIPLIALLLAGCSPRVATSFWKIGTETDSVRPGYAILTEGAKVRHCYPITEWTADPAIDTYHQLHHHGVAVESELMAYRIYFDKKQTIDPYCKRKPQLELAQSHWYPNDSLLAEGYGDDILRVSGTVGVGSVKYWNGKKMMHIEPVAERSQRIVKQTRTEATIEVSAKEWQVEGMQVFMHTDYTMRAGHRDMRCDVYVWGDEYGDPVEGLCTGVQTIPAKGGSDTITIVLPNGILLASWGTDWPVNDSAKYAKETVGLAVFIPKEFAGDIVQDKQNLLCLLKGTTPHFYLTCVGATKENHPVATSAEEWLIYLRRWAKHLR